VSVGEVRRETGPEARPVEECFRPVSLDDSSTSPSEFPSAVQAAAITPRNSIGSIDEYTMSDLWRFVMRWLVFGLVVTMVLGAVASAGAATAPPARSHCVVRVVDELPSGELVTTPPECYATLAAAVTAASSGTYEVPAGLSGRDLFLDPSVAASVASFTLGIHFDGRYGTGSSISEVGSSCTGGWWNTGASWANRISSSWNGCYRLRHHDLPNRSGSRVDTVGSQATHTLPSWMDNRTESVSYWGS